MPADLPPQTGQRSAPSLATGPGVGAFGEAPAPPPRARQVYNLPPASDFSLVANPTRWDVFMTEDGPEILPALSKLSYYPDQKGVRQVTDVDGKIVGDPSRALATLAAHGKVAVPKDWTVNCYHRDGSLMASRVGYVHRLQGARGPVHMDVWNRPYAVGSATHTERDEKGYHEFLRRVRDELLGPPDPAIVQGLRVKLQNMARISGEKAHRSPTAQAVTNQLTERLAVFNPPPKSTKRRK